MTDPALKSGLWVRALVRQMAHQNNFATILHKGDEDAGAIILVLTDKHGTIAALQERRGAWRRHSFPRQSVPAESLLRVNDPTRRRALEAELAAWLAQQEKVDPDLWVVELEIADATAPLEQTLAPRRGVGNA